MRSTWRSITIVLLMGLLCAGAGFAALRAVAQGQSGAEETATIKDDPTVAPDPKQSADNNVSFPVDI